jgi:hypothetical protein
MLFDPVKLGQANKYANLIRNKAKREYAQAYIAWLRNGAEGLEPEHSKLSYMAAQAVRMTVDAMKLWEGTTRA